MMGPIMGQVKVHMELYNQIYTSIN